MAVTEVIWNIFVSFHVICFLLLVPSYIYIIWETKPSYFEVFVQFTGLNEKNMADIDRYREINKNHSDLTTLFLVMAPIYLYRVGSFRWFVVLLSGFIPSYFLGLIIGLVLANIIGGVVGISTISPYTFPQGTLFDPILWKLFELDPWIILYVISIIAGLVFWWICAKFVKFMMNAWAKTYTPTKSSKSKPNPPNAALE
tara:strand:- start:232 stop:828 length:597 start_codon:yes stop_codon:yes gene_type:complete